MKITKIHILSFGGLENFILEPEKGLNRICRANEFGKTTLVHFIYYMFYGYEAKRLKGYFPWNGAPMAGSLEFELDRHLWRIERSRTEKSTGKTRLLNAQTGEEVPLPARQQPGPYFLKLDGETFLRSFCITQGDLPFGYTDGLDKALKNLASSGDEGVSYEQALKALKEQRTRYAKWDKRGGALDRLLEELSNRRVQLAQLRETLSAKEKDRRQSEEISEKLRENREQTAKEKEILQAARKSDALRILQQLEKLEERQKTARTRPAVSREQMEALSAAFAAEETAKALWNRAETEREESRLRLQYADETLHTFGFTAHTGDELEKAQKKGIGVPLGLLFFTLTLLCIAGGVLLSAYRPILLGAAGILALAGAGFLWYEGNRKTALCRRYGAGSLTQLAEKWGQYQALWESRKSLFGQQEELRRREEEARRDYESKNVELQRLKDATGITSLRKLEDLRVDWRVFESENDPRLLEEQKNALLRGKTRAEWEALAQDAVLMSENVETVSARLHRLQEEYDLLLNRYRELEPGDLSRLWEEYETLERSIAAGEEAYAQGRAEQAALEKSIEWLKAANEEMNTQFSPKICETAGKYLETLTNGKYSRLRMDAAFHITLESPAGTYEAERFSAGTRDAVYFAFRLAAADLLTDVKLPMILDDPFLNLDPARLNAARTLLENAAENRQILYFSCRD